MILNDFSSIVHRMIATSISNIQPQKSNGKYITSEFIGLVKYYILQDLFSTNQQHSRVFGDIVICLDGISDEYWRKDIYPGYKARRKIGRDESDVDYDGVSYEINILIDQIRKNLPWKVIDVPGAEADDIMLVLSRTYNKHEKILINSPDKDMLQAQDGAENVFQYSSLTKKWLVPEHKHKHMGHWLIEHVCLGDVCDEIPKVVDHTEFSKSFLEYLLNNGYTIKDPYEFKIASIDANEKKKLLKEFSIYKVNRKGESTGIKDVFKDMKFGPVALQKELEKYGSVDSWLDSHPLYRIHYDRNFKLIMEDGIPSDIWNEIVVRYKEAKCEYNDKAFEKYLKENNLNSILLELPNHFKIQRELTAEDYGW